MSSSSASPSRKRKRDSSSASSSSSSSASSKTPLVKVPTHLPHIGSTAETRYKASTPASRLLACSGFDITRKASRAKGKLLCVFPGIVAPPAEAAGSGLVTKEQLRLGELYDLDTPEPKMYINAGDKGRLRLVGRIVKSRNQFIQLAVPNEGKGDSVVCENTFRTVVVFTEAGWVDGPGPEFPGKDAAADDDDARKATVAESLANAAEQYEREESGPVPEDVLVSGVVGAIDAEAGTKEQEEEEEEEGKEKGREEQGDGEDVEASSEKRRRDQTLAALDFNFGNLASRVLEEADDEQEDDEDEKEVEEEDGDDDDDGDEEEEEEEEE